MASLTITDAEGLATRKRPWSFRLEFRGPNSANAGGWSEKFWFATGRAHDEMVEVGWGAVGSSAQTTLITWSKLRDKVEEKLNKGYGYVDAPYRRMSPKSIAKLGGAVASAVATGTGPAPAPAAVVAAPPPAPATVKGQPVAFTPTAAQVALGEPWSLVHALKMNRHGTTVQGYEAQDANGDKLFDFDSVGGIEFSREHGVQIIDLLPQGV